MLDPLICIYCHLGLMQKDVVSIMKYQGVTEKEIKEKFNMKFEEVIKQAKSEKGFQLFEQRNDYNEKVLTLIRDPEEKIKIKKRDWKFARQEEGEPYMWIQLPKKSEFNNIRVMLISDIHFGHKSCDIDVLKQDIEYVLENPNVYVALGGDIIENSSKLSIAGSIYEQSIMPNEQINEICKLLAPIAHKILFYVSGNHEERTMNNLGIDIGELIAEKLDIPYFSEPAYIDLLWNEYKWTIFLQHGATSSLTKGGKMNAAAKPVSWLEFTNFIIMGHVHDKISNEVVRIVRDPVNFRLIQKKQYVLVLGAYLKHWNTYGSRKGYTPTSKGRVAFKIYKNGDYHISE